MGAVCAAGLDTSEILASFRAEYRRPGRLTLFDSPVDYPVFEVGGFPATRPYGDGVRTFELALHALREALDEACLNATVLKKSRVGVCLGTTVASQLNDLEFYRSFKNTGDAPMAPVRRYMKGNLADAVAAHLGVMALTATVTNACSSGADAIAIGAQWIEAGLCDIAIAGGADELNRIPYCGFNALGLGCPFPCTPFDKNRRGLNLGEGAGILVLESAGSAATRGFAPRLGLRGYGTACDAHHLTAPRPDGAGLRSALVHALAHAGVGPEEIAFVNAHGTGTQDNDLVEGSALAAIFGPAIPTLSTKGFTGHTLGAAGGLEAVFAGLGLREGWLPPSVGFQEQDERIPITPLRTRAEVTGRHAFSTSLAFGGNNTALLLGLLE
jgi:3-oxoacyl-(acyl-carrier-protein) synthase